MTAFELVHLHSKTHFAIFFYISGSSSSSGFLLLGTHTKYVFIQRMKLDVTHQVYLLVSFIFLFIHFSQSSYVSFVLKIQNIKKKFHWLKFMLKFCIHTTDLGSFTRQNKKLVLFEFLKICVNKFYFLNFEGLLF